MCAAGAASARIRESCQRPGPGAATRLDDALRRWLSDREGPVAALEQAAVDVLCEPADDRSIPRALFALDMSPARDPVRSAALTADVVDELATAADAERSGRRMIDLGLRSILGTAATPPLCAARIRSGLAAVFDRACDVGSARQFRTSSSACESLTAMRCQLLRDDAETSSAGGDHSTALATLEQLASGTVPGCEGSSELGLRTAREAVAAGQLDLARAIEQRTVAQYGYPVIPRAPPQQAQQRRYRLEPRR